MKRSLFWKILIPVAIIFVTGTIVLALWIPQLVERNAVENGIQSAERIVKQFKVVRAYYTNNVVKKVLANSGMTASFNHKSEHDAIPLPATLVHDLSDELEHEGTAIKLYSIFPFPNRSARTLDSFGKAAWEALNTNPDDSYSKLEQQNGVASIRVAVADKMESEVCVACHNSRADTPKNDWKLGDVRGVLEVNVPLDTILANGRQLSAAITFCLFLLLGLILLVLYFVFRASIAKPMGALSQALQNIAEGEGDLTQRLDESRQDEVGAVGHSFNRFIEKIQLLVNELAEGFSKIKSATNQLDMVSSATHSGVSEQKNQLEQLSSAIAEMSASFAEVANSASSAASLVKDASATASKGSTIVNQSIDAIGTLNNDVAKSVEVLKTLQSDSQQIGSVLNVIRGIAEQTNLLALNAAIEAARAGEQGRGFAVVADEVRNLASKTQSSTEEIDKMIEQFHTGVDDAVNVANNSQESTNHCVQLISEAGEALEHIDQAMEAIDDMNHQIASAVEQQAAVSSEISENVCLIDQNTENLVDGANTTNQSSDSVNTAVNELSRLISRFKV